MTNKVVKTSWRGVTEGLARRFSPAPAAAPQSHDASAQVTLAYRAVLRRDPDPAGLRAYVQAIQRDGRDAAWVIARLAESDEFRALAARSERPFPLDEAPPMTVQLDCDPDSLQALWDRVAATWSELGETDPHWSVLTEERFRASAMTADALAAYHETGAGELRRLRAWLHRAGLAIPADGVCAEFGCGTGRITRALAPAVRRVIGFDVSAPHLRAASAQIAADGLGNVDFVQVRGPADLGALAGIDLFYSIISLQHSPPPIIMDVLQRAFAGLRPGGCAFFQLPTYGTGYTYPAAANTAGMEMHFVPQQAVFAAAHNAGLRVLEVQPDWCTGRIGEWISNTFLLQRA